MRPATACTIRRATQGDCTLAVSCLPSACPALSMPCPAHPAVLAISSACLPVVRLPQSSSSASAPAHSPSRRNTTYRQGGVSSSAHAHIYTRLTPIIANALAAALRRACRLRAAHTPFERADRDSNETIKEDCIPHGCSRLPCLFAPRTTTSSSSDARESCVCRACPSSPSSPVKTGRALLPGPVRPA